MKLKSKKTLTEMPRNFFEKKMRTKMKNKTREKL